MKESAQAAFPACGAGAVLGIEGSFYKTKDIHVTSGGRSPQGRPLCGHWQ